MLQSCSAVKVSCFLPKGIDDDRNKVAQLADGKLKTGRASCRKALTMTERREQPSPAPCPCFLPKGIDDDRNPHNRLEK